LYPTRTPKRGRGEEEEECLERGGGGRGGGVLRKRRRRRTHVRAVQMWCLIYTSSKNKEAPSLCSNVGFLVKYIYIVNSARVLAPYKRLLFVD
jgi:hypothetical protein